MVATGGKQKVRAWATLITLVLAMTALAGCEVADDVGVPGPDAGPSVRSAAPRPPLPTQDAAVVAEMSKNMTKVQRLLGAPPKSELMSALGGTGFRQTRPSMAKGAYLLKVACVGTPSVLLTVSQPDRRNGTRLELPVTCGRGVQAAVKLESGPTTVQLSPNTTDPDPGAAAGYRLERSPSA